MGGRTTTMREDIRPGGALSEAKVLWGPETPGRRSRWRDFVDSQLWTTEGTGERDRIGRAKPTWRFINPTWRVTWESGDVWIIAHSRIKSPVEWALVTETEGGSKAGVLRTGKACYLVGHMVTLMSVARGGCDSEYLKKLLRGSITPTIIPR
jgi:hypothetical protein